MKVLSKIIIFCIYLILGVFYLYTPKLYDLLFKKQNVLNVYTYADFISPKCIKVNLKYFDNDNELLAKFEIDEGRGYDLITATGFVIKKLIDNKLLQKINISKLYNYKKLENFLLGSSFDPKNNFSVPYLWSIHGIIFNKNFIKLSLDQISWDLIFKNPDLYLKNNAIEQILMINTPVEIFQIAAIYLFGSLKNLTSEKLEKIAQLLIKQKRWVDVYMTGSLQYYLLSRVVDIAVTYTAFAQKIMDISDEYDFVIPKEGSIVTIDSFAIPKTSKSVELSHKFIDFLLSTGMSLLNAQKYGYNPSNKYAYKKIQEKFPTRKAFFPDKENFEKLYLQDESINLKKLEDLWLAVRLS
ncbi:PotD/PotF family extracellular solute-binding protein [Candidatus Dependentiae bacterium]